MTTKEAIREFKTAIDSDKLNMPVVRLRNCSALVIETPTHYLLQSYETIIASINKQTGVCIDALRVVYGYTNTSAQHIRKFREDYNGNYCYHLQIMANGSIA